MELGHNKRNMTDQLLSVETNTVTVLPVKRSMETGRDSQLNRYQRVVPNYLLWLLGRNGYEVGYSLQ